MFCQKLHTIRSTLYIQVGDLYYSIECSTEINILNVIVVDPDDGLKKQTETCVSKAE